MAAEMTADCSLVSRLQGGQGIDHWVMSWKATDGDAVGENGIVKAVETWMECMGYGGDYYKWTMSVGPC